MIFGITYGNKTTEYTEYRNQSTEKLWRFEYNPILYIAANYFPYADVNTHVGIFSHKFREKTGKSKEQVEALLNPEYDLINFSPKLGRIMGKWSFMEWSAAGHGETLVDLIKECCSHTGLKYDPDPEHIIYANQFTAKRKVYTDYVETIIKPCLELLEGELWDIVNQPAGYTAGLELAELKKNTGLDFYNYLPFVLERMTMQYVVNRNIKTTTV